ncbi:phosphoenolpyruvate synthase [Candidatus Daviesbacteria bacterium]|nr:phosphoenolpyruvate synthase [Candidatus Daviesbacteria bacterium]
MSSFIKLLKEVSIEDVSEVGGKNASLGEMIQTLTSKGIKVPGGYVVTASAYRYFLKQQKLDKVIQQTLHGLDTKNLSVLAEKAKQIRNLITQTPFPNDLGEEIKKAHISAEKEYGKGADFAVRSSATAEDLPGASFAGEHETYLNISGVENILEAIRKSMASLFTERAISYREDKGFDHLKVALSVGVQKMVRSDLACSGIIFTLDTETGFPNTIVINGTWGLGELIVQGQITPDEYLVFKPTLNKPKPKTLKTFFKGDFYKPIINKKLGVKHKKMVYDSVGASPTKIISTSEKEQLNFVLTDEEVLILANWAKQIEDHYSKKYQKWTPMDIEWAKDGKTNQLFIVQSRPETVHAGKDHSLVLEYILKDSAKPLISGAAVGNKISTGKARVIKNVSDIRQFQKGEILVTEVTDPDWEPIMKIASAIVTDKGGRTSHAAIVSRELGIACVVGTEKATQIIKTGQELTVDCSGSEGIVYAGRLKFQIEKHDVSKLPKPKTKIMLNIATPESAFEKSFLPNDGVGLAREEFITASEIGIHPQAILNYASLDEKIKNKIKGKIVGFSDPREFYIEKLAFGIAQITSAFYPKPVLVRLADFKTNEYRSLIGGEAYEPVEENPMIGWRGASRYYSEEFNQAFLLEIQAFKKVIDEFGLDNLQILVPFCRTVEEGKKVIKLIEENGLARKNHPNLNIYVMCEIPSNVILAEDFLEIFDGMSIGSNDLTQLVLGIDRDGNQKIRGIANENDLAVKELISQVIKICKDKKKYIGICGQAPSDYPDFAAFLVTEGIESISLNPDSLIKTLKRVYQEEQK